MPTFLAADGADLAYTDDGPRGGIPLLFLHGWNGAATLWTPVIERLAPRHRALAVDFRGFGASSGAPGPYRVEAFSDDLSALILALDLDPLVVIGHSMGAAVAQRFAIDRPDAVEGLVLVAPVPASGVAFPPKVDAYLRSLPGDAAKEVQRLDQLTIGEPTPQIRALVREAATAVTEQASRESYESWTTLDFADDAATIVTPTLVVASAADRPLTPEFVRERVADLIEGSRLVVLHDAAHYVTLEWPERIAELIEEFVDRL